MKYEKNKIVYEVGDWVYIISTVESSAWGLKDGQVTQITQDYFSNDRLNGKGGTAIRSEYFRPATQEEIDKVEEEIKVGDYLVKFHNYSETCTDEFIEVGCQKVTKDLFLKIGKKANWI